jgi:uridine phosphorylase
MSNLKFSELILTKDNCVYHLGLNPDQIGKTIFTVGDPNRVSSVSKYFDHIDSKVHTREFYTHTGVLGGERVSVISTGIGTDNIDIVINELDALVNIDLNTRELKTTHTKINFIRIGTTGSISKNLEVDDILINTYSIGLDGLLHFYNFRSTMEELELEDHVNQFLNSANLEWPILPYYCGSDNLMRKIFSRNFKSGIGFTAPGFYGPQGRSLRTENILAQDFFTTWDGFDFKGQKITNLEMETSGIYGLSKILNHRAISCNVILADRLNGRFSQNPEKAIDDLIQNVLKTWTEKVDL